MSERFWASGHWQLKEAKAEEFIQPWREWLSRSSENVAGFRHARLLRALNSAQQFTSMSEWDTAEVRNAWKAGPAFREGFDASKALSDEFVRGDTRSSSSGLPQSQADPRQHHAAAGPGARQGRAEILAK